MSQDELELRGCKSRLTLVEDQLRDSRKACGRLLEQKAALRELLDQALLLVESPHLSHHDRLEQSRVIREKAQLL